MTAVTDSVRMAAATVPRAQPRGLPEQQRYQRHQLVGLLRAPAVLDVDRQDNRVHGDRVVHARLLLKCRDLEDHDPRPVDGHARSDRLASHQEELRRVSPEVDEEVDGRCVRARQLVLLPPARLVSLVLGPLPELLVDWENGGFITMFTCPSGTASRGLYRAPLGSARSHFPM